MMNHQKIDLALAFLQAQPDAAIAILEQQPIEDITAFLAEIPDDKAIAIVKKMLPQYTARICKNLACAMVVKFLSSMDIALVAAILRYLDKKTANNVLNDLPEKTKIACKLLLNYTDETVGAWMFVNITLLPNTCTVEEAHLRLASTSDELDASGQIYVVNRQRQLQGSVNTLSLLYAESEKRLTQIMEKCSHTISARMDIVSAINHPIWHGTDTVAVINRQQQVIGRIRHVDLRKAIATRENTITKPYKCDPLLDIWKVYGSSLLTLFNTASETLGVKTS